MRQSINPSAMSTAIVVFPFGAIPSAAGIHTERRTRPVDRVVIQDRGSFDRDFAKTCMTGTNHYRMSHWLGRRLRVVLRFPRRCSASRSRSRFLAAHRLSSLPFVCLALWLSGCAPVAPWERGHLAKPHMALEPLPTQRALREHNYSSREASAGAISATGGGCGCN